MTKTLLNKFDKKNIGQLPRVLFEGKIVTIFTEGEAQRAVDYLLTKDILGLDTETRPSFKRGQSFKVALLQVSTRDICFLFRLNRLHNSPAVKRLLEDEVIPKIGLSLHDDVRMMHHRIPDLQPGHFIDLQNVMKNLGVEDMSLAKLYANVFGQRISKREQLSNWEAETLSEKQKRYAATDAWACIMLYEEYLRLMDTHDYVLEKVPEPEPPVSPVSPDNPPSPVTPASPEKYKKPKRAKNTTTRKPKKNIKKNGIQADTTKEG